MTRLDDILMELDEVTQLDGFTALCADLKEEMVFYDQGALVALVTGVLEGLLVNALATAALAGDETYESAAETLEARLKSFGHRLREERTTVDARALVDRYVKDGLPPLRAALVAQDAAFRAWLQGEDGGDIDLRIAEAREALEEGRREEALRAAGLAGALVLRGTRPRPVWLRTAGPATGWVNGLFAIREALSIHPDLPYPLGDPGDERQIAGDRHVVDLRSFRRTIEEGWDDVDRMWQSILSETPVVRREDLEQLEQEGQRALPILMTLARAPEFRRTKAAFVALTQLRELRAPESTGAFLSVVAEVPPDDPLFLEAKKGLLSLGQEAKGRVFAYLADDPELAKQVSLSEIVARYHGDDHAFAILTALFRRTGWSQGKDVVARCLAYFGDVRALPVLDEALKARVRDDAKKRAVSQAIRRLEGGGRTGAGENA